MLTSILIGLIFAILIVWQSLNGKYRRIIRLFDLVVVLVIVTNIKFSVGLFFGVIASTFFYLLIYSLCYVASENNGNNDN